MRIHHVKALEGANFFSYQPVIRGVIDIGRWQRRTTKEFEGFNEGLLRVLPTLASHTCSRGRVGGFIEKLEEGTLPGHVMEHVAIELLALAGEQTRYGKTRLWDENKFQYEVIYQYECKEAALEAFFLAVQVVNELRSQKEPDIPSMIEKLKTLRLSYLPGPSTKAILEACQSRGIPTRRLSSCGSLYQLGYGRFQRRIQAAMTDQTSCIGVDIAGDKQLARKILAEAGIPVPYGKTVRTEKEVLQAFRGIGRSCVIKPCRGNQGKGVSLDLNNESDVLTAFRLALTYDSRVIVEEYISGNNYRLLVVGDKLVAAAKRIPPLVVGDGKSCIQELIEKENKNPWRGEGHENYLTKITPDSIVIMDLHRQGLTLASVPRKGERIILRKSANLSTGATAEDVTDFVHPDNRELAIYSAKNLGLDIAGVDMIMEDISRSYKLQEGRIIEINVSPGLRMHLNPSFKSSSVVGPEIVRFLFPQGNGRIPIVSVTGTNGKTTTVRLISKILQEQNLTVGMTSSEGIFINDKLLKAGDLSGPESARTVLGHKEVQIAVLETARGGILRSGLGYDYADVAVITNISEDHLGQYGIDNLNDLKKVKSLVAEMVQKHSYVVLNADDQLVMEIKNKTQGRVILFSTRSGNRTISKHLALGGVAVVANQGTIKICIGAESILVGYLNKIPLTWDGKALHNVQNVLAAVGACWALGYSPTAIRKAIYGFGQNAGDNRGRLEYHEIGEIKVILDYGHNVAGIRETIKTLRRIKPQRLIGCIGIPGDRSDYLIKKFAAEAALGFDFLYIKEDSDLRGRKKGEVADLIAKQVLAEGFKENNIKIILKEEEAFKTALLEADKGDMVVIFYEKAEPLRRVIQEVKVTRERGIGHL
ncbi:MAG: cyanophycin synthetase [Desulfitobacteriia bacterium]|jgi:cyanophycin synthetase